MMQKRSHLLLGLLLMISVVPVEAQISYSEEQLRVRAFVHAMAKELGAVPTVGAEPVRSWDHNGQPVLLLFALEEPYGFVLISTTGYPEVIPAWSINNRQVFPDDLPPALEWMVSEYVGQIVNQKGEGSQAHHHRLPPVDWHMNVAATAGVTPLVPTTWDQRCYYNDSCPSDPLAPAYYCGRAPAGCVATTLAQILRYHKWPLNGTGTKSYYSIKYGTLSANFGATPYAMASMPAAIYSSHPEVARLLWHCGVATQMNFGPYASGTGITDARTALITYFGYKTSAQIVTKNSYADAAWKTLMRAEIDQGRPVFYSGVDPASNTGHAWVLDGYSGSDYFHFNWGWSGIADGYFMLSALDPLGSANYVNFQEAIIGIEPTGTLPLAAFSADVTTVSTGSPVIFSNLSTGSVTTWQWFFEGGTPALWSGAAPPPVTWSKGGIHDIMLVVSNGSITDTLFKRGYIRVLPIAGYTVSHNTTEAGHSLLFADNSESVTPLNSWKWQFPGGNPASFIGKNPGAVHYPVAGQYPVIMEVSDGTHKDRRVFPKAVTVYNQCDTLLNHFMPGWSVQAVNQPSFQVYKEDLDGLTPYHQAYISSGWDYFSEGGGANHFVSATSLFQSPGQANNWYIFGPVTIPAGGAKLQWRHKFPDHTKRDGYQVKLSTTGHTHSHFTTSPIFSVYDNDPYTLGDTAWTWREAKMNPAVYGNQQVYVGVNHYANNMFYLGLDDFLIIHCDTFPHKAGFWAFDTVITAGDTIIIYDLSTGTPDQVQWSFPGGTIISSDPTSYIVSYPSPGSYDVSQTVWYGTLSNSLNKPAYIQVKPIGIESNDPIRNAVLVSPNPFKDLVSVFTTRTPSAYAVCDARGVVVQAGSVDQQHFTLDLAAFSPGFWFLHVYFPDHHAVIKKLIKY